MDWKKGSVAICVNDGTVKDSWSQWVIQGAQQGPYEQNDQRP